MARNKKTKDNAPKSDADQILDDVLSQDGPVDDAECQQGTDLETFTGESNDQDLDGFDLAQTVGVPAGDYPVVSETEYCVAVNALEDQRRAELSVVDAEESAGEPKSMFNATLEELQEGNALVKEIQAAAKSNLKVSVASKAVESTELLWQSQPAGELEPLLRQRAVHHALLHYGITVSLTDVSQELIDKCQGDYRFLREIARLTRPQ